MELQIGIRLHDTAPGSLEERLASARAQGFRCVHLALSKTVPGFSMKDAPRLMTEEFAARVRELLERYGLTCAVLGCYLTPGDPRPEEAEWILACYKAHLRFARQIGALTVGSETPAAKGFDPTDPAIMTLTLERAALLAAWAEEEGVTLALEPVYRHVIRTPELAERLLEYVNRDSLRLILDAVNLISSSTSGQADDLVDEAIRRCGDRVAVLHMKDYLNRTDSEDVQAVACGLGHMRYDRLLRFNREQGGLPMTLENTTPDNAVAAREYLEQADAALGEA